MARKATPPAAKAPQAKTPAGPPLPASLAGLAIAPERLASIATHVALLAQTALVVGDTLPLQADASDYARVLDEEAR